jgi:hypothetical protein
MGAEAVSTNNSVMPKDSLTYQAREKLKQLKKSDSSSSFDSKGKLIRKGRDDSDAFVS